MQSLTKAFNSLGHTIKEAITPSAPAPHVYTRADIIQIEEAERERRMHDSTTNERKATAARASSLISSLKSPYFRGSLAGSKRLTARAEEHERARRLLTKPELALRKSNANRTAGMIHALGWPFIRSSERQGPLYVFADETSLLEEQERLYRIQNPLQAQLSKNNAALASNALRWGWTGLPLGSKRYTRSMEEKERSRRLTDREELWNAAERAYQVSGLIRNLGHPFYVQNHTEKVDTLTLEQEEQRRRLADKTEQVKARQHASIVSRLLPIWAAGKSGKRAEQERARRMSDAVEQQQAMQIAKQLSTIVAGSLLNEEEEKERIRRIKHADFDAVRAREVASLIQGLQFSKANANSLYNREAHRRLRDILNERVARQNAHTVASLVAAQPGFGQEQQQPIAAPNADLLQSMEEERKQRMYDWSTQQNQMRNARKASDMIKAFRQGRKQSPFFQAEKERHRRMVDGALMAQQMQNAKKVSNMLRGNSAVLRKAPARSAAPVLPLASPASLVLPIDLSPAFAAPLIPLLVEREAPLVAQAMAPASFFPPEQSLPRDAPADFMPPAETLREALPFQSELLDKTRAAPPAVLPFKQELLQTASARPEPLPRQALPFQEELLSSGPQFLRPQMPQQQALPFRDELLSNGSSNLRPHLPQQQLPFREELLSSGLSQLRPRFPQQQQALPFKEELLSSGPSLLHSRFPQQQVLPFQDELLNRGPSTLRQAAPLQSAPLLQQEQTQQSPIASMPVYGHSFLPELKEIVREVPPAASAPFSAAPLSQQQAQQSPVAAMPLYGHSFLPELKETVPKAAPATSSSAFAPFSAPLAAAPLASAPLASAPLASAPLASAPLASAPLDFAAPLAAPFASAPLVSSTNPFVPTMGAPLPRSLPQEDFPSSLPLPAAPTATAAPISALPLAAPMSKPPMGSAPILSAPLVSSLAAPTASRSVPLSSGAPIAPLLSSSQMANLPYATPINAGPLLSSLASPAIAPGLGTSSSIITASLYGSAPLTPASAAAQHTTFYSAAGAHVLTEQQRRRLDKQALKHNRKAAKDNARSEKLLQKAEKLHQRGKDARAEKKENKAEQKAISSKQHALWANDLLHKQQQNLVSANGMMAQPAPVFRPAM